MLPRLFLSAFLLQETGLPPSCVLISPPSCNILCSVWHDLRPAYPTSVSLSNVRPTLLFQNWELVICSPIRRENEVALEKTSNITSEMGSVLQKSKRGRRRGWLRGCRLIVVSLRHVFWCAYRSPKDSSAEKLWDRAICLNKWRRDDPAVAARILH